MPTTPAPIHLNSHHRETLEKIFTHPAGHNIEWHSVLSLLEAVATVEKAPHGRFVVTLGSETETIDPPKHKDIDAQQVVDLRRMLKNAGFDPADAEDASGT
jgi:hypothetical protein